MEQLPKKATLRKGQKVLDWDAEFDNYLAEKRKRPLSHSAYAKELGVSEAWLSTNFAQIRRQRYELDVRNLLPKVMAESLRDVASYLKNNRGENGVDDKHKQAYALDAFAKTADRAGFSPQAVMVNVQQNNTQAVVMPPIFGGAYADGIKQMLGDADDRKD